MPVSLTSQLIRSAPYFPVADVERSAEHYERVLGFRAEYAAGSPPQFAILSRDGLAIMLRRVPAPKAICPNEMQGGTWVVTTPTGHATRNFVSATLWFDINGDMFKYSIDPS